LDREISAATERLQPTGSEGVAKALRTLLTGGLSLSSSIAAKDMNTVYSYALSGLSNEALVIVCKKLVRGEYDIDRKAFIPLPPEMSAMVRAEQRIISEDLARARAKLEAVTTPKPADRSPEAIERVRKLRQSFLATHKAEKEKAHPQAVEPAMDEERQAYFDRILALKDAPVVTEEHMIARRKYLSAKEAVE